MKVSGVCRVTQQPSPHDHNTHMQIQTQISALQIECSGSQGVLTTGLGSVPAKARIKVKFMVIKTRRTRCVVHVVRMGVKINAYKLVTKFEGKWLLWGLRRKSEDSIKMCVKEMGCEYTCGPDAPKLRDRFG